MSSWYFSKFNRALSGLATLSSQPSTSAHQPSSKPFVSKIPVPSKRQQSAAFPAVKSPSQFQPIITPQVSVPAPTRTEDSILKHVERIRKMRQAQATTSAFARQASRPAQSRPVERPVSRVPSDSSNTSMATSSSASRNEKAIEVHVARMRGSPSPSPRPSPPVSRKVSPLVAVVPLCVVKKAPESTVVDLAQVDFRLAGLTIRKTRRAATPALRSCLKSSTRTLLAKTISFKEYGGWNLHGIRTFDSEDPADTFLPISDADIRPPEMGRQKGEYRMVGDKFQIRWPPEETDPRDIQESSLLPRCRSCVEIANVGTHGVTHYEANRATTFCDGCLSDPARRMWYAPQLDYDGRNDDLDVCVSLHAHNPYCELERLAQCARLAWLYAHYPDRYPEFELQIGYSHE
ncbi:hypothetical protein B0O99DRAFT_722210 [Bisporella sp. PMI_857]|nr:hypothetical protein B0O99DRAFT_722210 [Bisporella sp. PMI_857]